MIFTVGHSNRTFEELRALLDEAGVELLVDVRRYPGSRRHPHFRREALAEALAAAGIEYRHASELGGHREPRADSPHVSIAEPAFRGYADHMASEAFERAAEALRQNARGARVVVMCAERLPASCHRRLLSDWLLRRGEAVVHLLAPGEREAHRFDPRIDPARLDRIVYCLPEDGQLELFDRV